MTDQNYTHIAVVLDRSGSMASIKDDMVAGLNEFFEEQAALEGKCMVDLVQFDNEYEVVFSNLPVKLAKAELHPRGSTALLDAIGKTVTDLGAKLRDKSEKNRPANVMVVVVTDGYENASREWTKPAVRDLIKQQTDEWNWDFVFLGTGFDAVAAGRDYGFSADKSLTFSGDKVDVAYASLSNYTSNTRSGLVAAAANSFSDEDRTNNA